MHPEMSGAEVEVEVEVGEFREEARKIPERRMFSAFPLHPQSEGTSYRRVEETGKWSEEPRFCLACSEIPENRGLRGKEPPQRAPATATSSKLRLYEIRLTGNEETGPSLNK